MTIALVIVSTILGTLLVTKHIEIKPVPPPTIQQQQNH